GQDRELAVSTDAPDGVQIIVSGTAPPTTGPPKGNKTLHLNKGTTDIWITISAPDVANGQYFGRITLDPKANGLNPVTIPVAFNKKQGVVTLTHTCSPTTIPARTGLAHCSASIQNFGSLQANATLTVTNLDKGKGLDFTNVSAPANAVKKDDGVQWSGILTPSIAPTIDSLTDVTGNGPAGGSPPPACFRLSPVAGAGGGTRPKLNLPALSHRSEWC